MNDQPNTGYRFSHARKDANSPNGKVTRHIVAIARDIKEATDLAEEIRPAHTLKFIGSGEKHLQAARNAQLRDGEAKVL